MRVLGLALAVAIFATAGCARAETPMSLAAFRDAYAAEVRHRRPDAKVEGVAPDQLSITLAGGAQITAVLDNAYDHYRDQPSQLRSVLNDYVSAMLESAAPPTYTAVQLLVLVRPATYAQAHAAMVAASPEAAKHGPLLTRPIAGDLVAMASSTSRQPTSSSPPRHCAHGSSWTTPPSGLGRSRTRGASFRLFRPTMTRMRW